MIEMRAGLWYALKNRKSYGQVLRLRDMTDPKEYKAVPVHGA